MNSPARSSVGIVIIGRNEGARLARCLNAAMKMSLPTIYVDSGSTDSSVALARSLQVHVLELDDGKPFTAARSRNEGLARLIQLAPDMRYVQFLDGDCELNERWIEAGLSFLESHDRCAIAFGALSELHPHASVYNTLCNVEWHSPVGPAKECGGNMLARIEALLEIGSFNEAVISGEDSEMCFRMIEAGWGIQRVDAPMALHDAEMTRLGQWWKRNVRAGHCFAELSNMHSGLRSRESRSVWFWAAIVPLITSGLAWITLGISAVLLLGYGVLFWKIVRYVAREGFPRRDARIYAVFTVLGKFPQLIGMLGYCFGRISGTRARIIEYKEAQTA